ncbi:MFS transporter [soil metagenome]
MSLKSKPTPLLPVALGTALVLVTYVTPIVSVPVTASDLGVGVAGRAWILSSMSVGLAAALLVSGVIGDTVGRRRVSDAGLVLLALGAVLCAVAWGPGAVIVGSVVEGVGGAAVLACGLSLLAVHFAPGAARVHATSVWGASVGLGIALGSVAAAAVGGVGSGWRETYAVTAVAALGLLLLSRYLGESRAEHPRRIDVPGLVLLVAGMTLLVAGLTQVRNGVDVPSVVLLVAAVVALVGFAVVERRVSEPLVEPELLRHPGFVAAGLGSLTLGVSMIGVASFVPTMAQVGLGRGVWTASLLATTWALVSVASSLLVRRLPWAVTGPRDIAVVLVLVAVAQATGLGLTADSGAWRLGVMMAAAGLGTGVLNAVLGRESVASVPPDRSAMGSGANNTARYLGAAVGITLFVTIATHAGDSLVSGWNVALAVAVVLTLVGAAGIALVGVRSVPVAD